MTTPTTLNRQIEALQSTVRGGWVKFQKSYHTNAFEAIYHNDGEKVTASTLSDYYVSVIKEDGAWFVYAEEHDIDELIKSDFQPKQGFKTLKEAKEAAESFGAYFESCWKECEGIE